jgi:hypothetical protein
VAVYERGSGGHVAERVRPAPGSADDERYAALAADPASGWHVAAPDPVRLARPAKSASKTDWVAYAVQEGMDAGDADKATRDELAARYADGGGS